MKALALRLAMSADMELARIQTFVLDALASVTAILESAEKMTLGELQDAVLTSTVLIGNANVQICSSGGRSS